MHFPADSIFVRTENVHQYVFNTTAAVAIYIYNNVILYMMCCSPVYITCTTRNRTHTHTYTYAIRVFVRRKFPSGDARYIYVRTCTGVLYDMRRE